MYGDRDGDGDATPRAGRLAPQRLHFEDTAHA